MATSAGSVTIDLDANSVKLLRELQKASRKTKTTAQKMQANLTRAFKGIASAAARIGPALAVGLTALTQAGIRSADSLAKTSAKLGIAADELAGLRFAAEQTGVGINALDMGLQRMIRRVAEAAQGTGEAKAALAELGLNAQELSRVSPAEQFKRIADAMDLVSGEANKVRLSFKLFDSEGVALKNTLAAGRAELERFEKEAKQLGLTLEPQQLKAIEDAADAQNKVSKAFVGLSRQLASTFAPAITSAANTLTWFVSHITDSLPVLTAFAARILNITRGLNSLSMAGLQAEAKQTAIAIDEAYTALENIKAGPPRARRNLQAQEQELLNLQKRYAEIQNQIATLNEQATLPELTGDPGAAYSAVTPTAEQLQRIATAKNLFNEASASLETFFDDQKSIENFAATVKDEIGGAAKVFADSMRNLRSALSRGLINEDEFVKYKAILLDNLVGPLSDIEDKTKDVTDQMATYSEQAARNIQDAFADFLFDPFEDGVKGMLEGFLTAIRQMMANKLATQLFSYLGDQGGFLGALFGKKAAGGPVSSGNTYLVGEKGPEILHMGAASGNIVPNHRLQTAGGGVSVVNNIDARGADEARIMRVMPVIMERTRQETIASIMQLQREGSM